jgi:hypothetical protein
MKSQPHGHDPSPLEDARAIHRDREPLAPVAVIVVNPIEPARGAQLEIRDFGVVALVIVTALDIDLRIVAGAAEALH